MHAASCSARSCANAPLPAPADAGHHELWFDAWEQRCVEDIWFDARDGSLPDTRPPAQKAEHLVPFTEDCRRAIKKMIQYLGDMKQNALIATGLARLLPGLPLGVIAVAHSLYISVTEKRDIDLALLNTLGMVAVDMLSEGNVIAHLADFIKQTLLDYTGISYFSQFLSHDHNPASHAIYLALGLLAISTRFWMIQEPSPQRSLLRVPVFFANLLIRIDAYWHQLSCMAQNADKIAHLRLESLPLRSSAVKIANSEAVLPVVAGAVVTTALSTRRAAVRNNVIIGAVGSAVSTVLLGGAKLIYHACLTRGGASTQQPEATREVHRRERAIPLAPHAAIKSCHEINLKTLSPAGLRGFKLVSDMHGGGMQPATYRQLHACLLAYFESVNGINSLILDIPKVSDSCNALNLFLKRKMPAHNARVHFSIRVNAYYPEIHFFTLTDGEGHTSLALGRVNNVYFVDTHEGGEKVRLTDTTLPLDVMRFINMDVVVRQHESGWRVDIKRYGRLIFSRVLQQKPRFASLGIGSHMPLEEYRRTIEIRALQVKALPPVH
ncbi:hypothetical protein [Candidatus Symbiopectobacterium sp. NZEC151]|uniref:hypothetical protein n=1 Tax=Candidatus Symbiopectobacterium sp. NZEC151 TaxID=2820470 RepID=UPI0022261D41|nr:hypothetical protein [Candidatus Symbiopectobacterium sp. NZEC151]MCW2476464.1 hypothetical protein [Candidatus Symbiopectobacterium sp. NZEC151]